MKILDKIFNKLGYVRFDKKRELIYQLYKQALIIKEELHYSGEFGEEIIIKVKSIFDL